MRDRSQVDTNQASQFSEAQISTEALGIYESIGVQESQRGSAVSSEIQIMRGSSLSSSQNMTKLTIAIALSTPSFSDTAAPAPPANKPSEAVLDLTLADIISFLQQYQESCPTLRMACPHSGVPLPSIDVPFVSSPELSATLTLSIRLSQSLIKHVMKGR